MKINWTNLLSLGITGYGGYEMGLLEKKIVDLIIKDLSKGDKKKKFIEFMNNNMILINPAVPLIMTFPINPKEMKISSSKIITETRTAGGFVYEHWGETPELLNFSGVSLGRYGDRIIRAEVVFNLLRQFYKLDKISQVNFFSGIIKTKGAILAAPFVNLARRIGSLSKDYTYKSWDLGKVSPELSETWIFLRGVLHRGFFKDFSWDYAGENEYYFSYSFNFQSIWNTANWLETGLNKLPDLFGVKK